MPRLAGWLLSLLLLGVAIAGPLHAQALQCRVPDVVPVPRADPGAEREPPRTTEIGAYTLALTWSPQFCRMKGDEAGQAFQCGGPSRFGFVLHGLWPDGTGTQWPQYCAPASILPPRVVRDQLCTTPSADLMQHEWEKHGTCMSRDPAAYFAQGRALYGQLRYPDMNALSRRRDLTVGDFARLFAAANRIPLASVRVRITRANWLDELWLCLDRDLRFAACGPGQGGGFAPRLRLRIWRPGQAREDY